MSERTSTYNGKKLDIVYDRKLCIHVGECGRADNALFDTANDPWCDPDAVSAELATEVVRRCPTGALKYIPKDGVAEEAAPKTNEVTVAQDGPLYLTGELEIDGADGQGVPFRAALCRCGASQNKPFCDKSHVQVGFRDSGAVGQTGGDVDDHGGPLRVDRAQNGPFLLKGNFTIRAATGRVAFEGTKAALCRCGHSKNKPFCDGSHGPAGFLAD